MDEMTPEAWLAATKPNHKHTSYKRGCEDCILTRTIERAVSNGTRSEARRNRTIEATRRDRLEKRLYFAEDKGLRWRPDQKKCSHAHACRCQDMEMTGFKTPEHRAAFIEETKEALGWRWDDRLKRWLTAPDILAAE